MVTKTVPKKGKFPKRTTPSLPRRKSARLAFKGKSTVGESAKHGGKSAVIPIPSDDSDNEARILENLLIHKEGKIEVLQEDLQRARNFNQFLEVENKQMKFHAAIHEARAIKYKKEAERAQVRIEELIGEFDDEEEEDQPRRKRPRTIGLRRALEKQKAEEQAQFEAFPLTTLFEREIEENKEAWLERANQHLETKLEKANRDLELQRKRTLHFQKLNQFARRKLKVAQEKLKKLKERRLARKEAKRTSALDILASASEHVSMDP